MKTTKKVLQKMAQLIDNTADKEQKRKINKDYLLLKVNDNWVLRSEMIKKYKI